ncbi:MAG: response regulator [Flavobacteriales bacterium]|nr:response regulator [Flavobacteriales bacterium]
MRKLNRILLVDDDNATNFLHQLLLEEMDLAENIDIALNGKEALDKIEAYSIEELPQLILLDINMPFMNGFEFLEQYEKLDEDRKVGVRLMMITTSTDPRDLAKSKQFSSISGFLNKPLTDKKIIKLWDQYFKNETVLEDGTNNT